MPYCNNCGNDEAFEYRTESTEVRFYDPETDEHIDTEHVEVLESRLERCAKCLYKDVSIE